MKEKVINKKKELQKEYDSWINWLEDPSGFPEEYIESKLALLRQKIWLLEDLLEGEE